MATKNVRNFFAACAFALFSAVILAQDNVPLGIHYQAVARDNFGNELVNRKISVRFSIISEDPLGTVVYQELHQDILTSRFGVFSLIIGHGTPTGKAQYGELSQIAWESAFHFLKVEVKFENDFMDMGTMQFLSVPYALYARRSLEPGPEGPKGDTGPKGEPGDPASDNQTLSFDGSTLSISGGNSLSLTDLVQNLTVSYQSDGTYLGISRGNSVKLATIEADGDPKNELQDLTISSDKLKITNNALATEWDLSPYRQSLLWDPATRVLSISGNSSTINLSELKNDADADITNEIQDIQLSGDLLTITKNSASTGVNLGKYLDNTDSQQISFNQTDNILSLTNSISVDLSSLKDDADHDISNEIQDLNLTGNLLSITKSTVPGIDLGKYIDNTDAQQLSFNSVNNTLNLTGSIPVDLTPLINDADADPANEIQSLSYNPENFQLSIDKNGNPATIGQIIAFRAGIATSITLPDNTPVDLVFDNVTSANLYNEGSAYNSTLGSFQSPYNGIYTFSVTINLPANGSIQFKVNGSAYETLIWPTSSSGSYKGSITVKLAQNDLVKVSILQTNGFAIPSYSISGNFSGFRVY